MLALLVGAQRRRDSAAVRGRAPLSIRARDAGSALLGIHAQRVARQRVLAGAQTMLAVAGGRISGWGSATP